MIHIYTHDITIKNPNWKKEIIEEHFNGGISVDYYTKSLESAVGKSISFSPKGFSEDYNIFEKETETILKAVIEYVKSHPKKFKYIYFLLENSTRHWFFTSTLVKVLDKLKKDGNLGCVEW